MKKVFYEENCTIEFLTTIDDLSLIVVHEFDEKAEEHITLLTQFYDFDVEYLIKYYQEKCDSIEDMKTLFI